MTRDNSLPKFFVLTEAFYLPNKDNVRKIDTQDAMFLRVGDVVLVRSTNVKDLGDHFIIVTGPIVQKPHGLRPETVTVSIEDGHHPLLDEYDSYNGVTALKLDQASKELFLGYHNIVVKDNNVIFPNQTKTLAV